MPENASSISIMPDFRYRGPGGDWLRNAALWSVVVVATMWWEDIQGSSAGAKLIMTFILPPVLAIGMFWHGWIDITAGSDGLRLRRRRDKPQEFAFADVTQVATRREFDADFPYPPWLIGSVVEFTLKTGRAVTLSLPERKQGELLNYLKGRGITIVAAMPQK